jgi:hypothetical protein
MPLSSRTVGNGSPSLFAVTMSPRDSLRQSMIMEQAGSGSRFLNEQKDFFAMINGGTMNGVIQQDYTRDYVVEMRLKDQKV